MTEDKPKYRTATGTLLQPDIISGIVESERPLSTLNLDEIDELLREIERHTWPFLNAVRKARGKKPMHAPRG